MNPVDFVHPHIRQLAGYVPGLQTEDPEIIKLNTNENPFPVSAAVKNALIAELQAGQLQKYPNPVSQRLREALSKKYGPAPEAFLVGNGSDEILSILFRAVLSPESGIVTAQPTYSLYPVIAALSNARCVEIPVKDNWHIDLGVMLEEMQKKTTSMRQALCAFANPNAPTGITETEADLLSFAKDNPGLTLIDEAYADFGNVSVFRYAGSTAYPRLLVSGTASKALSLAGQRIGWLAGPVSFIQELEKIKDSYNVSKLAQVAACAAVQDSVEEKQRIKLVLESRDWLIRELDKLGFTTLPSSANFIFTKPPVSVLSKSAAAPSELTPAGAYYDLLLRQKILVRYWNTPQLKDWIRITIGTQAQMETLLRVTTDLV
ncbi:MAG: histidinol-phosphate transaminase [Leptospirales bacterium]|nr:histidinol-phosphate transaminase [Leptospirales bacterium]